MSASLEPPSICGVPMPAGSPGHSSPAEGRRLVPALDSSLALRVKAKLDETSTPPFFCCLESAESRSVTGQIRECHLCGHTKARAVAAADRKRREVDLERKRLRALRRREQVSINRADVQYQLRQTERRSLCNVQRRRDRTHILNVEDSLASTRMQGVIDPIGRGNKHSSPNSLGPPVGTLLPGQSVLCTKFDFGAHETHCAASCDSSRSGFHAAEAVTNSVQVNRNRSRQLLPGFSEAPGNKFGPIIQSTSSAVMKSEFEGAATPPKEYIVIQDGSSDSGRSSSCNSPHCREKQEPATRNARSVARRKNGKETHVRPRCRWRRGTRPNSEMSDSNSRYGGFDGMCCRASTGHSESEVLPQVSGSVISPTYSAGAIVEEASKFMRVQHARGQSTNAGRQDRARPGKSREDLWRKRGEAGALEPQYHQERQQLGEEPANYEELSAAGGRSACEKSAAKLWPHCVASMLGPEIFERLKQAPELVTSESDTGMTLFHHMLRHPSRDDEQMLNLFKCIFDSDDMKEHLIRRPLTKLKCNRGQTLAFYAACYGHAKCLEWILEQAGGLEHQRQYLEVRDENRDTPLHYAAREGHVQVIELLLDRVPGMLNEQRRDGRTPLFDALGRPDIVRLLLRHVGMHGADFQLKCGKGLTPLEAALCELRCKRKYATRGCKPMLKRLSSTVALLRKAEGCLKKSKLTPSMAVSRSSAVVVPESNNREGDRGFIISTPEVDVELWRSKSGGCTCLKDQWGNCAECMRSTFALQQGSVPTSSGSCAFAAAEWNSSSSSGSSSDCSVPLRDENTVDEGYIPSRISGGSK